MDAILNQFSSRNQAVTYGLGLVAVAFLYSFVANFKLWISFVNAPYAGIEKLTLFTLPDFVKARNKVRGDGIWEIIQEGYHKYKGEPFKVPTFSRNTVILPPKYFNELRNAPEHIVSNKEAIDKNLEAKYTGTDSSLDEQEFFVKLIRADLTQGISKLVGFIQEEAIRSFNTELADVTEDKWTEVPIFSKILRIVAQTSGRLFVGDRICRQEGWITESIMFTVNVFEAAARLKEVTWIRKKLFWWTLAPLRILKKSRQNAYNTLKPEILRRRREEEEAAKKGVEWKNKPNDLLEWFRDAARDNPKFSTIEHQAKFQLILSMAAIHTTTITSTHIIYDLASHPQYIDELREEIRTVLGQYDGVLTKAGLQKMSKLDSCMKESQRFTPLGVTMVTRQVTAPQGVTLSNGVHLPYGTHFHAPHDPLCKDPELWENPDEYDPFRFHRLRQQPGKETSGQFVTTTSEFAAFGHGSHACPGRFFASAEVKGFLVILLSRYEFRIPGGGTERPANWRRGWQQGPNPMAMVEFKLRPANERFY